MTLRFTKTERIALLMMALFAAAIPCYYLFLAPKLREGDETLFALTEIAVTRLLASGVFVALIVYMGYALLSPRIPSARALLCSLPAILIAANNFPILALCFGQATVEKLELLPLLFLACLGIGLFEEAAFRGVVFPFLLSQFLEKLPAPRRLRLPREVIAAFLAILSTSAVFGIVHLLNLFAGADPLGVILQIGYSFLIGGMCAIVLTKTRSIWIPVFVHALFDCGGYLITYLGSGTLWDTPTVILTVVLSVLVTAFYLILLFRTKPEEISSLLP